MVLRWRRKPADNMRVKRVGYRRTCVPGCLGWLDGEMVDAVDVGLCDASREVDVSDFSFKLRSRSLRVRTHDNYCQLDCSRAA